MTRMIERLCIICGENMQIILDENERIVSGAGPTDEYWECESCYEEN